MADPLPELVLVVKKATFTETPQGTVITAEGPQWYTMRTSTTDLVRHLVESGDANLYDLIDKDGAYSICERFDIASNADQEEQISDLQKKLEEKEDVSKQLHTLRRDHLSLYAEKCRVEAELLDRKAEDAEKRIEEMEDTSGEETLRRDPGIRD